MSYVNGQSNLPRASSKDHRNTQPDVEGHEDEHQEIAQSEEQHVQKTLYECINNRPSESEQRREQNGTHHNDDDVNCQAEAYTQISEKWYQYSKMSIVTQQTVGWDTCKIGSLILLDKQNSITETALREGFDLTF